MTRTTEIKPLLMRLLTSCREIDQLRDALVALGVDPEETAPSSRLLDLVLDLAGLPATPRGDFKDGWRYGCNHDPETFLHQWLHLSDEEADLAPPAPAPTVAAPAASGRPSELYERLCAAEKRIAWLIDRVLPPAERAAKEAELGAKILQLRQMNPETDPRTHQRLVTDIQTLEGDLGL